MTSVLEDLHALQWLLANNICFRSITIDDEIVLSLPRLCHFINVMSLQKITSVIIIADLLLTWQHLTTMNISYS